MTIDLPPQYDPHATEAPTYKKWLDAKAFHAVAPLTPEQKARPHFSIVIPPPNVTGALHLGHAINGTIQDILTRYHRMNGDNTLWMPGIDHAGIATQAVVEKTIFEKEKKNRHDLGREELVRRIWEWKEQYGTRILSQLQSIGSSCDWDRTRFTLDDICAKAVREAFFKMFKDGLIFRGKRLVNWDTHLQTAVADDEIYHESVKGQMTSIRYPVADDRTPDGNPGLSRPNTEYLTVATTRPETMLGDTAVAVHPDDPRYTHLHGKFVIVPLVGRRIPIITDGQLVDPAFGTGVVKVTPAHDPNDYATGQRHNLEQINLLTPDGKVNEKGSGVFLGKEYNYTGLKFATAARKQVLADLEELGLIADKKPHDHEVGHSDRSKTPIEPFLSDQWFVRMGDIEAATPEPNAATNRAPDDRAPDGNPGPSRPNPNAGIQLANGTHASGLAQAAIDAVTSGRVKITPDRYAKGYIDWLSQKRDWCISRQLWWGHRIPVWSRTYRDRLEFESQRDEWENHQLLRHSKNISIVIDPIVKHADDNELPIFVYACVIPSPDAEEKVQIKILEAAGFVQDPDVLDTWFSSALWPLSTMGWPNTGTSDKPEDQLLPTYYPTSVLSTARDILTLWVARMVMFGLYCHGDVPFKNVYVHPVIQDGDGKIMSKSKGNGVDPVDIINSHGADALRFTLASLATETQDIRMPVTKDPKTGTNTSPKFDIGRNFANKIWNASRFILSNISDTAQHSGLRTQDLPLEDRWILSRLHTTISAAHTAINTYHFADLAESLRSFFWTDLCDWYLEIAKARIKSGDATVQSVLLHCLETSLKLLHPMMPFISEEIWSKLPNRQQLLIKTPFPTADASRIDLAAEVQIALIQSITSAIRDIQNRYPAAKGKEVLLQPRDAGIQQTIEKSKLIIEPLANVTIAENSPSVQKPKDAVVRVLTDVQIYMTGIIDKAAESAKLTKRKAELEKLILANRNKLGNEAFVSKAPPAIIQGLRDQLENQQKELAAVELNLVELTA